MDSIIPGREDLISAGKGPIGSLIQSARTFRTSSTRMFYGVILPATLPAIAAGLRTVTSLGLVVAVHYAMLSAKRRPQFRVRIETYQLRN
jgi:ABC-type nitrate/sulfonate/bicarbonate transport system permease component